ncbi:hypothetical protein A3K55_01330 [Candidatus Shapirobacteria bacterium RBG_13_44_7]|uniref:Flavodoxin-like domain-containing protein n=1 Tax=Candidatus Shapirobacteria bacterium RBG_13_44_7 TaxID=1802149 RepID=A0A1F7SHP7_9BACT|nr:MAG: hypothetical protein A3K55_01330 [Candidatus Shapirobacteria bacterium RBG_13_44_7]
MKKLVVYDSNFGNTKLVAEVIAKELGKETGVVAVADLRDKDLEGVEGLVVGSPIIGWRPSERMGSFLDGLKKEQLKGVRATSFDTRVKLFIHGEAAEKIAKKLEVVGAKILVKPEGFYVGGKEGPLLKGEIERARKWAGKIKEEW